MDQGAAGGNKRNGDKRDQIDQKQTDGKIENQIAKYQRNWQSRCAMWCNSSKAAVEYCSVYFIMWQGVEES